MPLPLPVEAGRKKIISLPVGYVPISAQAKLILGFSAGSPETVQIDANGNACRNWAPCSVPALALDYSPTDAGYAGSDVKLYGCDIPADSMDRYILSLEAAEYAVLAYVEVQIR